MASQDIEPIHFTDLLKDKTDEKSSLLSASFLFFLFLISFLFVYFLYVCIRCRAGYLSTNQNQNGGGPVSPSKSMGLDPATIKGLPIFSYGSSLNDKISPEAECSICLALFQEGDKVKVLPQCHHGFHYECVDKWLSTQSTCPLCRKPILQPASLADLEIS
ncbi:hypothetical protein ACH5RR_005191 [Cinchona calisaya]|uniref:RING-type E3 ubiquitin transferase n=1 Tax=Cinchona calisaya TaxID=153742 RepID=A0ABD3AKH2_9GENT